MKESFQPPVPPAEDTEESSVQEKEDLQGLTLEVMNLIHASDFDAASEKVDAISDEGRKKQLQMIMSLEKRRKGAKVQKDEQKTIAIEEERPQESVEEGVKIYEDPSDDPIFYKTREKIKEQLIFRTYELKQKINTEADEQKKDLLWEQVERTTVANEDALWREFASTYPEKAFAYKDKVKQLARVLVEQGSPEVSATESGFTPEEKEGLQKILKELDDKEKTIPTREEAVVLPKEKQEYLDSRRTGIENDESLSRKEKDEMLKLVDELEGIETAFRTKTLTLQEWKGKRARKRHILGLLTTGAETGITKEQIEGARDAAKITAEAPANLPIEGSAEKLSTEREEQYKIADELLKSGDSVKVVRSNGIVEDGWKITYLTPVKGGDSIPEEIVLFVKNGAGIIKRYIPLEKFIAWQDMEVDPIENIDLDENIEPTPAIENKEEVVADTEAETQKETELFKQKIDQVIESVPEKERPSFMRRIVGAGLLVQEKKNSAFAGAYEWAANKYTKDGEKETTLGRFLQAAAENYAHSTEVSKKQKEDIYENKVGVGKSGLELLRSGALIMRAVDPFKWFKPFRAATSAVMVVGRYGDIAKEARLKNTEALRKKTRLDEDEAMNEALTMYAAFSKEIGDTSVTKESLDTAFFANLPNRLREQFEKGGLVNSIANFGVIYTVKKIQKELEEVKKAPRAEHTEKTDALIEKHRAFLKYLDTVVTNTGTMDFIAETGRRAGVWSKRIATVFAVETALESVYNIVDWFRTAPEDIAVGQGANASPQNEVVYSKDATGAGTAGIAEIITSAHDSSSQPTEIYSSGFENDNFGGVGPQTESGVFEYGPHPEIIDIEKGGNIWSSAKELGERFNLDAKAFGEAWSHSVVTLPDGREIPIAELNLVHEGDILEYVPEENGVAAHFEFSNASSINYSDVLHQDTAEGMEKIHSAGFEEGIVSNDVHEGVAELPESVVASDLTGSVEEGVENGGEQHVGQEVSLMDRVNAVGIEKYAQGEADKELRWFFGQNYVHTDAWADIKDMSARKFEKMKLNPEGENMKLSEFKAYLIQLGKEAGIRPRGGIFRREESIEDFFIRVRRLITEQSLTKKGV